MRKFKFTFIFASVFLFLLLLATSVIAQEETPPPYAGLNNPFPWDDASVQEAGKGAYQQFCLGCHGVDGSNIASARFSASDFPQELEKKPDFYFWTLSEGRPSGGMPAFKAVLSEEQRWQVLTYVRSLGAVAPPVSPPPSTQPPSEGAAGSLQLIAPEQGRAGQPMTLRAVLMDNDNKPIVNATVKFLTRVDFFTKGLVEIGEAMTDEQGVAVFEYISRQSGEITFVAHYEAIENEDTVVLAEAEEAFYQTRVGLHFPGSGGDILIGPDSAFVVGEGGDAPMTGLRIPSGLRSWPLVLYVGAVMLVWILYLYAMSQVLHISAASKLSGTNTKLVPLIGMSVMIALVIMLVLVLITYPYSHSHLYIPQ